MSELTSRIDRCTSLRYCPRNRSHLKRNDPAATLQGGQDDPIHWRFCTRDSTFPFIENDSIRRAISWVDRCTRCCSSAHYVQWNSARRYWTFLQWSIGCDVLFVQRPAGRSAALDGESER